MTTRKPPSIPEDTYHELIDATVLALYKVGYANLGVRDIDEEFDKSRQLINHYFDGKEELITELLAYLLAYEDERREVPTDGDPLEKLDAEIDSVLLGSETNDYDFWMFMTVIYEIMTQLHQNARHRELVNRLRTGYVEELAEIIEEGIEAGRFVDVDALLVAGMIEDLIAGTHLRKIYLGQDDAPTETREAIDRFVIPLLQSNSANEASSD